MNVSITFVPIDWRRYGSLVELHGRKRTADLAACLAMGPSWRDPQSAEVLEAYDARGFRMPYAYYLQALSAAPERLAEEIAAWMGPLAPADVEWMLAVASTAAEPLDLGIALETVYGLFSVSWRSDVWEKERPPPKADVAFEKAIGTLSGGQRPLDPTVVREAARALEALDTSRYPPPDAPPWSENTDPDGILDELLRTRLQETADHYAAAASAGWGMYVRA